MEVNDARGRIPTSFGEEPNVEQLKLLKVDKPSKGSKVLQSIVLIGKHPCTTTSDCTGGRLPSRNLLVSNRLREDLKTPQIDNFASWGGK